MPADFASPVIPKPTMSSAERFFQWALYLLLVSGFLALMGTGKLDVPSLVLVIPALLVRGYCLFTHKEFSFPEQWTGYLTILYFAFYVADYFFLSQSFVSATVHLVLFIVVIKIFSVRRERDVVYLTVLSFGLVLFAVVLTVDTLFLATFALFILAAMATFISMEMRRSERDAVAAPVPYRQDRGFHRWLTGLAVGLGLLTLGGSALIFLVLPRISSTGYLRSLGVQSPMLTGFSNDVRLGGIGQIQQSPAVVMHVQILYGKLPADVKWRGIALANFDGHRWWNPAEPMIRQPMNGTLDLNWAAPNAFYSGAVRKPQMPTLSYRVVMEPVGLNLFFLAPVPLKLKGDYRSVSVTPDGSFLNAQLNEAEMSQPISAYTADADARNPEPLVRDSNSNDYPPRVAHLYLQLPRLDPRVRELARRVTASSESNYARARAIESFLHNNFSYTLELPGVREADPLATFLFLRKRGHCEYFASSMAIMLRTLNIPSRVVNGFRGGEYNDLTGNYIVRERDAHSWVEAYFPEFGWVTFDPTPAASQAVVSGRLARLDLYMDAAREIWREWVLNYDFSHQMRLSNQLSVATGSMQSGFRTWTSSRYRAILQRVGRWQQRMESMSPSQMALACGLLALLLAVPFTPKAWSSLQRARTRRDPQRAPTSAASFWYLRMLQRLARHGIRKSPAQTPAEFTSSIADLRLREDVAVFTEHYQRARFAGSVEDAQRLPELYEEMAGKR